MTMTLKYEGLYTDLVANEPAQGSSWAVDPRFEVETVTTERKKGALGETTVNYVADLSLAYNTLEKNVKLEIVWQRNDAPLVFKNEFALDSYLGDAAGNAALEGLNLIEDYLQTRNAAKRAAIFTIIQGMGANAVKFLELRRKGVDSTLRFLPICRKTTLGLLRPSSIGADLGKIQAPAFLNIGYPTDFTTGDPVTATPISETLTYVKMRDDAMKTGRNKKWERVEEWHGYPAGDIKLGFFR
jgi:hypothetical protein